MKTRLRKCLTTPMREVHGTPFGVFGRGLVSVLLLSALISVQHRGAVAATGYDWLQFGGNAQHGGNNAQESTITGDNVATLTERFRVALPSVSDGAPIYLSGVDWPTYMHDQQRSSAAGDSTIGVAEAGHLVKLWSFHAGGPIAASASIVGDTVYIGSWDGFEYALDPATGALKWKTDLGRSMGTDTGDCQRMGISSTATVQGNVLYVGGGAPYWYALNATIGRVLWRVRTGDERENGRYYNWASPLLYKGFAYIGIASHCDEPLVHGALLQVSLRTHRIVHTFDVVPKRQLGGTIWTSPALDPVTGTIYVTTGNEGRQPTTSQPYARAVVALSPDLQVRAVWQLPDALVSTPDSDWSSTPSLFRDRGGRRLLTAVNKNGYVYTFNRTGLKRGPVWRQQIADPDLNVSSTAVGEGMVFAAGSAGSWEGATYKGSVRAMDSSTGAVAWVAKTPKSVWPALTYVNGLIIDAPGSTLEIRNGADGKVLFRFRTGGRILGPASVSHGRVFTGSSDGSVYAFGMPSPTKGFRTRL